MMLKAVWLMLALALGLVALLFSNVHRLRGEATEPEKKDA